MRVLVVPELYRPDDAAANGTVNDAVLWARRWLERDPTLHLYWLLPPREDADYDPGDVLADRSRVTVVEADRPFASSDRRDVFTENGYGAAQLTALRRAIFDRDAYLDAVVDQLRTGRFTLYKWLCEHTDRWAAAVEPVDVIANVHDLQLPFKYRYCSYRNAFQSRMEVAAATFADGLWFTAGVDAAGYREYAPGFLADDAVAAAIDRAVVAGSPIEFDRYEPSARARPQWLHLAGSFWEKKRSDRLFDVAERLHDRFGVKTVLTSPESVPEEYSAPAWIEPHPNASRAEYEAALDRGDVAVCASEYETMARTPFEQAAAGQVLLLADDPWIYDSVPADYPLAVPVDALADLAVAVVDHWDESVAVNRRLVDHLESVRGPANCGDRTYRDLRRRVSEKQRQYRGGRRRSVVERALSDLGGGPVALDDVASQTAAHTETDGGLLDQESYAAIDLVYTLRALGYVDSGNPGTPVFRERSSPVEATAR